jgi:hypothetical protein
MRRRDLLPALATLPLATASAPAHPCDEAATFAPVLLHTAQDAWWLGPCGAQRLGLQALAVADGLWSMDAGSVQRWPQPGATLGPATLRVELDGSLHGLTASHDGAHVLLAHGRSLSLLDRRGQLLRRWAAPDRSADPTPPQVIGALPRRRSLLAAWPAQRELWEIQLDPQAPPIYDGLVHDWRMGEALPTPGHLGVRRIRLDAPMPDLCVVDPQASWVAGRSAAGVHVVHLDVRRQILLLPLAGADPTHSLVVPGPHWWLPQGRWLHAVDIGRWRVSAGVEMPAPVHAMARLPGRVLAWVGDGLRLWQAERWRALPLHGLRAIAADAARDQWLVADETALWRLDGEGRALASCASELAAQATAISAWPGKA